MTDNQLYLLLTKPRNRQAFGCDGKTVHDSEVVTTKLTIWRRSASGLWHNEISLAISMQGAIA